MCAMETEDTHELCPDTEGQHQSIAEEEEKTAEYLRSKGRSVLEGVGVQESHRDKACKSALKYLTAAEVMAPTTTLQAAIFEEMAKLYWILATLEKKIQLEKRENTIKALDFYTKAYELATGPKINTLTETLQSTYREAVIRLPETPHTETIDIAEVLVSRLPDSLMTAREVLDLATEKLTAGVQAYTAGDDVQCLRWTQACIHSLHKARGMIKEECDSLIVVDSVQESAEDLKEKASTRIQAAELIDKGQELYISASESPATKQRLTTCREALQCYTQAGQMMPTCLTASVYTRVAKIHWDIARMIKDLGSQLDHEVPMDHYLKALSYLESARSLLPSHPDQAGTTHACYSEAKTVLLSEPRWTVIEGLTALLQMLPDTEDKGKDKAELGRLLLEEADQAYKDRKYKHGLRCLTDCTRALDEAKLWHVDLSETEVSHQELVRLMENELTVEDTMKEGDQLLSVDAEDSFERQNENLQNASSLFARAGSLTGLSDVATTCSHRIAVTKWKLAVLHKNSEDTTTQALAKDFFLEALDNFVRVREQVGDVIVSEMSDCLHDTTTWLLEADQTMSGMWELCDRLTDDQQRLDTMMMIAGHWCRRSCQDYTDGDYQACIRNLVESEKTIEQMQTMTTYQPTAQENVSNMMNKVSAKKLCAEERIRVGRVKEMGDKCFTQAEDEASSTGTLERLTEARIYYTAARSLTTMPDVTALLDEQLALVARAFVKLYMKTDGDALSLETKSKARIEFLSAVDHFSSAYQNHSAMTGKWLEDLETEMAECVSQAVDWFSESACDESLQDMKEVHRKLPAGKLKTTTSYRVARCLCLRGSEAHDQRDFDTCLRYMEESESYLLESDNPTENTEIVKLLNQVTELKHSSKTRITAQKLMDKAKTLHLSGRKTVNLEDARRVYLEELRCYTEVLELHLPEEERVGTYEGAAMVLWHLAQCLPSCGSDSSLDTEQMEKIEYFVRAIEYFKITLKNGKEKGLEWMTSLMTSLISCYEDASNLLPVKQCLDILDDIKLLQELIPECSSKGELSFQLASVLIQLGTDAFQMYQYHESVSFLKTCVSAIKAVRRLCAANIELVRTSSCLKDKCDKQLRLAEQELTVVNLKEKGRQLYKESSSVNEHEALTHALECFKEAASLTCREDVNVTVTANVAMTCWKLATLQTRHDTEEADTERYYREATENFFNAYSRRSVKDADWSQQIQDNMMKCAGSFIDWLLEEKGLHAMKTLHWLCCNMLTDLAMKIQAVTRAGAALLDMAVQAFTNKNYQECIRCLEEGNSLIHDAKATCLNEEEFEESMKDLMSKFTEQMEQAKKTQTTQHAEELIEDANRYFRNAEKDATTKKKMSLYKDALACYDEAWSIPLDAGRTVTVCANMAVTLWRLADLLAEDVTGAAVPKTVTEYYTRAVQKFGEAYTGGRDKSDDWKKRLNSSLNKCYTKAKTVFSRGTPTQTLTLMNDVIAELPEIPLKSEELVWLGHQLYEEAVKTFHVDDYENSFRYVTECLAATSKATTICGEDSASSADLLNVTDDAKQHLAMVEVKRKVKRLRRLAEQQYKSAEAADMSHDKYRGYECALKLYEEIIDSIDSEEEKLRNYKEAAHVSWELMQMSLGNSDSIYEQTIDLFHRAVRHATSASKQDVDLLPLKEDMFKTALDWFVSSSRQEALADMGKFVGSTEDVKLRADGCVVLANQYWDKGLEAYSTSDFKGCIRYMKEAEYFVQEVVRLRNSPNSETEVESLIQKIKEHVELSEAAIKRKEMEALWAEGNALYNTKFASLIPIENVVSTYQAALVFYEQALQYGEEKAKLSKNAGMTCWKLAQQFTTVIGSAESHDKVNSFFRKALQHFMTASQEGAEETSEWKESLTSHMEKCFMEAMQYFQFVSSSHHAAPADMEAMIILFPDSITKANGFFTLATCMYKSGLTAYCDTRYKEGLRFLKEANFPVEEALRLCEEKEPLFSQVKSVQEDIGKFTRLAEAGIKREIADREMERLFEQNGQTVTDAALSVVDFYKETVTLCAGNDVVQEAICYSRIGKIYDCFLQKKSRAKDYYQKAVNSVSDVQGEVIHNADWFIESRSFLENYEKHINPDEEATKEKETVLRRLRGQLDFLQNIQKLPPQNLVAVIYATYPPKCTAHNFQAGLPDKKPLLSAIQHYHPDKQDKHQHGVEWYYLSAEITKVLTSKLQHVST